MSVKVEIFSQGDEIVTGQVVDSNAAWLSQQLTQLGFSVTRHNSVGDDLENLQQLLKEISVRADLCLCTGGLGPTVDDLTAEAVAQAFSLSLQLDDVALQQIAKYFTHRQRTMPDSNQKQALLPQGSQRLDNDWGTAPGFSLKTGRCRFYFMPGVPYEMRNMYQHRILPQLQQQYSLKGKQLLTLKTVGIGESDIQQRLQQMPLSGDVQLSFCANPEEVQTKFIFPADSTNNEIQAIAQQAQAIIGDFVFCTELPGQSAADLVAVINAAMQQQQLSACMLDNFSFGMLAAKCVGCAWLQSACFKQELQAFYNSCEISSQPDQELSQCASVLAETYRQQQKTGIALVQLAQVNAEELHDVNQTITVYHALATEQCTLTSVRHISGPVQRKYNQAAIMALDLLRRFLQGKAAK